LPKGPKIGNLYAYKVITLILPHKHAEHSIEQDILTPTTVPIHTPPPSPSPDVPEIEDCELPEDTSDTPFIRDGEAQEIEGTDGPGTAEEQDLGARQDFEKDERDDLANISYGNDEPHIKTLDLEVSALADDANESRDELTAIWFILALVCLAGWHFDNGHPDANSREFMERRVGEISSHFETQDLGEPQLSIDPVAKRLTTQPGLDTS
jgi:hypothetical protein